MNRIQYVKADAKKNETGKNFPSFFKISWKFPSQSWSNLLDSSYGSFSQVMEQLFSAFPSLFLKRVLFDWFPSKPSLRTKHLPGKCCFKMVQNCSMFGVFWMILLPWDARNAICLALIGYFSQDMGFIPGRSRFRNCFYNFSKFLFQTFLTISQNLLVFWKKL